MEPITFKEQTVVIAKRQPPYLPFPAFQYGDAEGRIASCWKLTWTERIKVLVTGRVWQQVLTFNQPLQPQKLTIDKPGMP